MTFIDRVVGRAGRRNYRTETRTEDEAAIDRYQQVLANAPADKIEHVHAEASSKPAPAQLDIVFERLTRNAATPEERLSVARPDTPSQAASRAEKQRPAPPTRTLEGGLDNAVSRSALVSIAGYVTAAAIVDMCLWDGHSEIAAATDATGAPEAGNRLTGIFDGGRYEL